MDNTSSQRFLLVKQPYGSHPWFVILQGKEPHPQHALWLPDPKGAIVVQTLDGPVLTDNQVRFFSRKGDAVAALRTFLASEPYRAIHLITERT